MAKRIGGAPRKVLESFQFSDPAQRVARLKRFETEILVGMHPVINWLERRRPADTAELVKRRMDFILREAVQCAGLDIPEYTAGKVARVSGKPTLGATRTATLSVTAMAFADCLLKWADDIEAEGKKPQPQDGYVDLDQIAAVVNRSKSTLERLKRRKTNPLPDPDVSGGGGKKDEWLWSRIRPWLETEFKKHFNETVPRRL